jgi:hypothetical protein
MVPVESFFEKHQTALIVGGVAVLGVAGFLIWQGAKSKPATPNRRRR